MEGHEYVYRMKPMVIPGLGYIILYPLIIVAFSFIFILPEICYKIFWGIYGVSVLVILLIWLTARSKRIIVDDNIIIFRSFFSKHILEPKDIRRVSFSWTQKNEEVVQLKTGKSVFYLSNLYFPFNELLTDLEEFIIANNVRSNLASHYGMK